MINSIGLPNRGLAAYLEHDLPALARTAGAADHQRHGLDPRGGRRARRGARAARAVAAIELNVSCPNVATGLDIGADPRGLEALLLAGAPAAARKPLIVKLTPNTADVAACARGRRPAGADAVSLINTLRAVALAPGGAAAVARWRQRRPSGPRSARSRSRRSRRGPRVEIPIIGMGGVSSGARRPRSDRCGRHAGGRRHGELPRSGGRLANRARARQRFHANCAMIWRVPSRKP